MGARLIHMVSKLLPRADLFKCPGRDLFACATCSRHLAPDAGAGQRWIKRVSTGETCSDYADVDRFVTLYSPYLAISSEAESGGRRPK